MGPTLAPLGSPEPNTPPKQKAHPALHSACLMEVLSGLSKQLLHTPGRMRITVHHTGEGTGLERANDTAGAEAGCELRPSDSLALSVEPKGLTATHSSIIQPQPRTIAHAPTHPNTKLQTVSRRVSHNVLNVLRAEGVNLEHKIIPSFQCCNSSWIAVWSYPNDMGWGVH